MELRFSRFLVFLLACLLNNSDVRCQLPFDELLPPVAPAAEAGQSLNLPPGKPARTPNTVDRNSIRQSVADAAGSGSVVVQTPNGPIRGKEWGMYFSWESIPYAKPPVGKLRFEDPQPLDQKWPTELNATVYPQYCLQWFRDHGVNKLRGQEDCLTLSIYTPKPRGVKYPVVVFLHGGQFMMGGGPEFDPEPSMVGSRIVMVKVNYRLGPLGFLSTGDNVIPGNYGLKDQLLALQWIKQNIANFDGDPNKILLLGHGAGGASTHLHMLRPSLANIAKAAISMSGVALNPWAVITKPQDNANRLAAAVNCNAKSSQDLKTCLQSRNATDIVNAVQTLLNWGYNPLVPFGPVVEPKNAKNAFLTEQPEAIIKSGRFSHIPWLVSYTSHDGNFNAAELLRINPRTGTEYINEMNKNWLDLAPQNLFLQHISKDPRGYAQGLKDAYLGDEPFSTKSYAKVEEMYTDVLVKNGVLKAMQLHSRYSKAPVYGFVYDIASNYAIGYDLAFRTDIKFGASHLDDITLLLRPVFRSTARPDEVVVSQRLVNLLGDFADFGGLSYGRCNFEKNTKATSNSLRLLWITKDSCETVIQDVN
ncbi:esterase P-like [Musca domestica]|uniref:carboxylesterase n=2 Tax=Musca domestica TaxID=7370 RepID=A0ABM3UPJ5_MUSDO|nr:esterase P-like [Musca domestica]